MARALCDRGFAAGHRLGHGVVHGLVLLLAASLFMASPAPLARADEANGAWQSRSQLVWDQDAQALVRKNFRVWDANPELDLEFSWEQQAVRTDDPDGTVNGSGRLTWRTKGTASYDRKGLYSDYQGEMRNGRPHGRGTLSVQSGLSYDGHWSDGVMAGRGAIKFPNGDDYQGEFAAGAPHGAGRYAAADGSIFEGAFRGGERHGAGTLIMPDGVSSRSVWESGQETARPGADRSDEFQVAQ